MYILNDTRTSENSRQFSKIHQESHLKTISYQNRIVTVAGASKQTAILLVIYPSFIFTRGSGFTMMQAATAGFPIPASLQDLEREPYNLLPYPDAFDDSDEAARADSFEALVLQLEQSNRTLAVSASSISLFEDNGNDDDNDDKDCSETWNNEERTQALYTLVRYA